MSDRPLWYTLDENHNPVPADDPTVFSQMDRKVAVTDVGEATVSTVFLCLDHSMLGGHQPILFETMIFGGKYDGFQDRYCTWGEAVAGHQRTVQRVKDNSSPPDKPPKRKLRLKK